MNKYETIFIMKNDIAEEQKNSIISTIKNYLNERRYLKFIVLRKND